MASWSDLRAGWEAIAASADAAWQSAYTGATTAWSSLIEANPTDYADEVRGFLGLLDEWDQYLKAASSLVVRLPAAERDRWKEQLASSRESWRYYGAGIYPHIEVERGNFGPVGAVQVLVGAAVIAVAIAGIAWAVAYYAEAQSQRDWAFYSLEELAARVKSMDSGKPLPDYSGPQQPAPRPAEPPAGGGSQNVWGWVAAGGGLALAVGQGIYSATRGH